MKFRACYRNVLDWQLSWSGRHVVMITCHAEAWGLGPIVLVDWPEITVEVMLGPIELQATINDWWYAHEGEVTP